MAALLRSKLAPIGGGSVSLAIKGNLARITISQPQYKNAMSGKMMTELLDAVERLERDETVSVVQVTGEGDFFCSGADLSVIREIEGKVMCEFMQETTARLGALPAITVALVNGGGCVGGGTEMATACDIRLFGPKASWRCVHPKMGISPGWGGGRRLASILGRAKAIDVLCNARKLSGKECLDIGLCDGIAPEGKSLDEYCQEYLSGALGHPAAAVRACKQSIAALSSDDELRAFAAVWGAKDFQAALSRGSSKSPK